MSGTIRSGMVPLSEAVLKLLVDIRKCWCTKKGAGAIRLRDGSRLNDTIQKPRVAILS